MQSGAHRTESQTSFSCRCGFGLLLYSQATKNTHVDQPIMQQGIEYGSDKNK